jgi:hypothetical protein
VAAEEAIAAEAVGAADRTPPVAAAVIPAVVVGTAEAADIANMV